MEDRSLTSTLQIMGIKQQGGSIKKQFSKENTKRLWVISAASGGIDSRLSGRIHHHFPEDDVVLTKNKRHIRQFVQESVADLTMIVGGDGAWREALEAAKESQVLGYLPAGTLNQTKLELGIPTSVVAWYAWQMRDVYLGQVESGGEMTGFFLMLGAGVEADAVAMVRPSLKSIFGRFAYFIAILERLIRPVRSGIEVTIGERSWHTCQVLVQRGRYYAGPFSVAPKADIFQSEYRVLIWKRAGRIAWCIGMAARMFRLPANWFVEEMAAESLTIRSGLLTVTQVDGDLGPKLPMEILPACPRWIAVPSG